MHCRELLLLVVLAPAGGCSRRLEAPAINPAEVAAAALAEYDANKDGWLDAQELDRCPGLKNVLTRFDRDKDGRLSRAELEECFAAYRDSKLALQQVVCQAALDGQPLVGTRVVLEPEAFMGGHIQPAEGVTDANGLVRFKVEGAPLSGCHLGVYRVRITPAPGQTLPEHYNTHTPLGIEVSPGLRGKIPILLSSR